MLREPVHTLPQDYMPPTASFDDPVPQQAYEAPAPTIEAESGQDFTSSYEPPTSSYEPPSYQPYEPEPVGQPTEDASPQERKKKSFMDDDDDDDFAARAEALKKQQKAEADRAADEAFRKAAEADGKQFPHILSTPLFGPCLMPDIIIYD